MKNILKKCIIVTIIFVIMIIIIIEKILTTEGYISTTYGTFLIATTTIYVMLITNMVNHDDVISQLKQNEDFLELKSNSNNMRQSLNKLREFIQKHFPEYSDEPLRDEEFEKTIHERNHSMLYLYLITKEEWFKGLPTSIKEEIETEIDYYLNDNEKKIFEICKDFMRIWDIKFEKDGLEIKTDYYDSRDHKNEPYWVDLFENEMKKLTKMDEICNNIYNENGYELDMFFDAFFEKISPHNVENLIKKEYIGD
jgi:hypothetical protein